MNLDDGCVEGLKWGEPAAFERLIAEFEGPLFRFFYCQRRDPNLAEEHSAETFARLVAALPRFRGGPERLPAFVFATARHVLSADRRHASRRPVPFDATPEFPDPAVTPFERLANTEERESLLRALDSLEPDARQVVLLKYIEGLAIRDIADALGMPEGTVKSHLHRARERLKEILLPTRCEP